MRWALRLLLLGVMLQAPAAAAQPAGPAAAKQHFEAAKKAYKAGSYREAIAELDRAIELDPLGKDLFYNKGLVHEKLGELDAAIAAFKRYTELETDTAELEKAIQILRRLEGARAELAAKKAEEEPRDEAPAPVVAAAPDREERARPAERPRKGRLDGWVYATGGVAVAALAVGTYYGLTALATRRSTEEATGDGLSVHDLRDRARLAHEQAVVADVAFGVGAVALGAAALLYFTRDAAPSAPRVGAAAAPGAGFVRLEAVF